MSRQQTTAVKGIFTVVILFSHMRGYLAPAASDPYFNLVLNLIGQSMVVMFLFYSGYGIMEALKRDIVHYTATFIRRRFLKVWVMFAIAVALFAALDIALGRSYGLRNWLLCWTGYESIGNSNWFVFDILVLYLLTYAVLRVALRFGLSLRQVAVGVALLTSAMIIALICVGKATYWYDTVAAYPAGMLFSLYYANIQRVKWGGVFAMLVIFATLDIMAYLGYPRIEGKMGFVMNIGLRILIPLSFTSFIVALTAKVKFGNAVLHWLGVNAFAIYILQRLAMIVASHYGWNVNGLAFAGIVIPMTLAIVVIYTAFTDRVLKHIA